MVYWDRKHEIAVKELDAISWSAKKAGVSYGTFVSGMKPEQYTEDGDRIPTMATIQEAANQTGLSYDYIRKLCIQDKIVYVQIGAKRLVNMDKLRGYLNRGEAGR